MTRVCKKCGVEKPLSELCMSSSSKYGRRQECKDCYNARKRKEEAALSAEDRRTRTTLRAYGMTQADFLLREKKQDGRCAICACRPGTVLVVDHDHTSKEVRELLCQGCNKMLGNAKDNPIILRVGAEYLEKHSGRV